MPIISIITQFPLVVNYVIYFTIYLGNAMTEKSSFRNSEAIEYLGRHGVKLRDKDFSEIIRTNSIFMQDPGTYKVTSIKSRGGNGYWITSKYALDQYINIKRAKMSNPVENYNREMYSIFITDYESERSKDILLNYKFYPRI